MHRDQAPRRDRRARLNARRRRDGHRRRAPREPRHAHRLRARREDPRDRGHARTTGSSSRAARSSSPARSPPYLPDGNLDRGFGTDGSAALHPEAREVVAMHVEPDGQILVGLKEAPRLQRLNPDGSPDTSFGGGGTLDIGFARAVRLADRRRAATRRPHTRGGRRRSVRWRRRRCSISSATSRTGRRTRRFGTNGRARAVDLRSLRGRRRSCRCSQTAGSCSWCAASATGRVRVARLSADGRARPRPSGAVGSPTQSSPTHAGARRASTDFRSDWRPARRCPTGGYAYRSTLDVPRERPHRMALVGSRQMATPTATSGGAGPRRGSPAGAPGWRVARDGDRRPARRHPRGREPLRAARTSAATRRASSAASARDGSPRPLVRPPRRRARRGRREAATR